MISLPDMWIDGETLRYLNSLRSNILVSSTKFDQIHLTDLSNKKQAYKPQRVQPSRYGRSQKSSPVKQESMSHGFCHQCKLVKDTRLLAQCCYDSRRIGTQIPQQQEVAGIMVYNVDVQNNQTVNHIFKQFGHKPPLNDQDYKCQRRFCSFCLETQYNVTNFLQLKHQQSWLCPSCMGVCQCTRCVRQDILTQVKGMLISMGGRLPQSLSDSDFDHYITRNFNTSLNLTLVSNSSLVTSRPVISSQQKQKLNLTPLKDKVKQYLATEQHELLRMCRRVKDSPARLQEAFSRL